ncbi:MAG: NAD-dependent protein deacylase [Proteobacteria bacterium]|nr:NAD-dependent protein deacylase [Pseudomonadota bacterium]
MSGGIVVLTGAGVSAESGVRTFRAADGLWEEHRIEDVATVEGFTRDPVLVHRFYNERRQTLATVQPNAAHQALANFEKNYTGDFLLVTQNIDDLHERAGSKRLIHMHGELLRMFCTQCTHNINITGDSSVEDTCVACGKRGGMRPDIVWFGEMPYQMSAIEQALMQCDLFVAIGTSGNVYPAAGFVQSARAIGARCVELNLEQSTTHHLFDEGRYGPATEEVEAFFSALLKTSSLTQ